MTDGDITTIAASISAIVAGLIGGWAGAHFTDKRNRNLESEKNRRHTANTLLAIKCELESVWQAYSRGPGRDVEEILEGNKKTIGVYPRVSSGFFTIYCNNSSVLGQVNDQFLLKDIILAYQRMMGIFESLQLNNQYQNRLGNTSRSSSGELSSIATTLSKRHTEIKPFMEELLKKLEKNLEKSS